MLTQAALVSLASTFEAMDAATYDDGSGANAWNRARTWPFAQWSRSLEFYPDIISQPGGAIGSDSAGDLSIPLTLRYTLRWRPSDTYETEGRAIRSIEAAFSTLETWEYDDCRIHPRTFAILPAPEDGWAEIKINCTLTARRP